MNDDDRQGDVNQVTRRSWYMLDVLLAAAFVLSYAGFFSVLAVVAYILGRQQHPPLFLGVLLLLLPILLIPSALMLGLRSLRRRREVRGERRILPVMPLVTILCIVVCLVLPFTRLRPPVYMALMFGLRDYARANVNVGAIQVWLGTLDPKICTGQYQYELNSGGTIESWWPDASPWAQAITSANPDFATLSLDRAGRPMIRIMWLGWVPDFHHYGLVVGDAQMETPPSDFFRDREYRMSLAPGAYVWHDI